MSTGLCLEQAPMRSSKRRRKGSGGAIAWASEEATAADGDEHISSDDSDDDGGGAAAKAKAKATPAVETEAEARVRLAKQYIAQLMEEEDDDEAPSDDEAEARDHGSFASSTDRVSDRLARDADRLAGHVFQSVADELAGAGQLHGRYLVDGEREGHTLPLTCVKLASDGLTLFTGSKDCVVIRWDPHTGEQLARYEGARPIKYANRMKYKEQQERKAARSASAAAAAPATAAAVPSAVVAAAAAPATAADADTGADAPEVEAPPALFGHTGHVLSIAVSSDGRRVATGGRDNAVRIWDATTDTFIDAFTAHRDAISGLAFRQHSQTLFSASFDRCVKIWNVEEMAYVDTLYGHQSPIMAIASGVKERAVTVGQDSTLRVWKVVDESQLVFRGQSSLDCVAMLDEGFFVSGDDRGTLSLWSTAKKKAIAKVPLAHGAVKGIANWITSVAILRGTDLCATGSSDGEVRFWKVNGQGRSITPIDGVQCPIVGFVNGLDFERSGRFLAVAVGEEHRLGRWWRNEGAFNGVRVVRLPSEVHIE